MASLQATVHARRPDLVLEKGEGEPIPATEPDDRLEIQADGQFQPVMTAHDWNKKMDPTGWWMCEKMDGVRALWTGQKLYTRQGSINN